MIVCNEEVPINLASAAELHVTFCVNNDIAKYAKQTVFTTNTGAALDGI